ncbi:MAG: IS1634 family transposase [Nanoarchaeota archaeon]|nr:IS1634 family transposase [Nanoarchaeota archaeon]
MFEKIFQNNISKRTKDKYLAKRILVMVLNRIISPIAKYRIQEWFSSSDLVNSIDLPLEELDEQKIYRSMDFLDRYIDDVQEDVAKSLLLMEKINFDMLYLDFTNQESYSTNEDSELLKKGHNKRKRYDLRQVNISLNCDAHSGIPFFYTSYPGNMNDPTFIKQYAPQLRDRLKAIAWEKRSTLIIDRGMNGDENFKLLRKEQFDYIGGLIEDDFPRFFSIPKRQLRKVFTRCNQTGKKQKIRFTSQKAEIYGTEHLVITAYSKEPNEDKIEKLDRQIEAYLSICNSKLNEFKKDISQNTFESRVNNVKQIKKDLKKLGKKLYPLFDISIKSYRFELTWTITKNEEAYEKQKDNFGKHVIFTNRTELEPKEVLKYFYQKDKVEKNFQILKSNAYNYKHIIVGPMFHKRDDRIESHVSTCMLALQHYQIIDHRLKKKEMSITTQQALAELKKITCYYTKLENNPHPIRHINILTEIQKEILEALEVDIFN